MAYESEIERNVAIIKSAGYSIRVMEDNGKVFFAASDLISVCGYGASTKKTLRVVHDARIPGEKKKMGFPMMTGRGYRKVTMVFLDLTAAMEVVKKSPATTDARKWIEESVFTYRVQEEPTKVTQTIDEEPVRMEDINKCIDRMLIEILEIKKYIAAVAK